jgi:hypothetical protein
MPITNNNQRGLVIISELVTAGRPEFREVYRWLQNNGASLPRNTIGHLYGTVRTLTGVNATTTRFVNALRELTSMPTIKEVDVILHLHGAPNKLYFANGPITMSALRDRIAALEAGNRLRALYSTACFGSSHADDFVQAGFTCASGAVAVNANSPIEFPVFLTLWAGGAKFKDCINTAENHLGSIPFDVAARIALGNGHTVNSDKRVHGNGNATIRTT